MNTGNGIRPCRKFGAAFAGALLLLCAGCLEKRIVWSPDGARAAVISDDGLYLCDAQGHLSGLLVPNVSFAAWRGDSRRLVLARRREAKDWNTIKPTLGADAAKVEAEADALWRDVEAGKPWNVLTLDFSDRKGPLEICARDRHAEGLRAKLTPEAWSGLEATTVELSDLVLAHVDGEAVVVDAVRHTGYGSITDMRVAPQDTAVAFTEESFASKEELNLLVASLNDATPAAVVAHRVAGYPDWSTDGKSVIYVEANGGGAKDDQVLGVLTARDVFDQGGRIAVAESRRYLAGMMFNLFTHVRCLRDGRVLFNAAEMELPMAAEDYGGDRREQLFALDPARQATLVRLIPRKHETGVPQMLAFFEVSPDERDVLIGGAEGEVAVVNLASGAVKQVQEASKTRYAGLPVWRRAGEFSYVRRTEPKDGKEPARPAEVVLREGDKEIVLSESWPGETLAKVASNRSK